MDPRLEKAHKFANYQQTIKNQRDLLRLEFHENTQYATNGGMFVIDPSLITYVKILIDSGKTSCVLMDIKQNPIYIEDSKDFYEKISTVYWEQINEFYSKMSKISTKRTVEGITSI